VKSIAVVIALVACDGQTSMTTSMDSAVGAVTVSEGGCPESIADYCNTSSCPTLAADRATCEGEHTVYRGCGLTEVGNYGVDNGVVNLYGDGGLIAVYRYGVTGTTCTAGPGDPIVLDCDSGTYSKTYPPCDADGD
jgi:hypothetical protein